MDEYIVLIPTIQAASVSPAPVSINSKFTISVSVSEIEKILYPEIWYSGEIYSGEV